MIEKHEQLIEDYLQGRLAGAEIQDIDALVRTDPRFCAALALAADDEATLLALHAASPAIGDGQRASAWPLRRLLPAGVALAAAAAVGWLWLAGMQDRGVACQVVETRGLVLLLPETEGTHPTPVAAGDRIAAKRRIWTCPWGAVALRLADGTRLQFDRASTATLADGRQTQVELIRGTVFVTRDRGIAGSAVLKTSQAAIAVGHGLAAVVVDGDRTVIEVSEGEAQVSAAGGTTTQIAAGQVAVLEKDGGGVQVRRGRLQWQLPDEAAAPGPAPTTGS
jgi:ferric-dicitrate binding protein FerR (iron transport regulator)